MEIILKMKVDFPGGNAHGHTIFEHFHLNANRSQVPYHVVESGWHMVTQIQSEKEQGSRAWKNKS